MHAEYMAQIADDAATYDSLRAYAKNADRWAQMERSERRRMQEWDAAYDQGVRAHKRGTALSRNPYDPPAGRRRWCPHRAWATGWQKAASGKGPREFVTLPRGWRRVCPEEYAVT